MATPQTRIELHDTPGYNPGRDQLARDRELLYRQISNEGAARLTGNTVLLDGERIPDTFPVTYPLITIWAADKFGEDEDGVIHLRPGDPLYEALGAVLEETKTRRDRDGNRTIEHICKVEFPWTGVAFPEEATIQVTTINGPVKLYRIVTSYANGVRAMLEGVRAR
jgi:hypothetical protein